MTEHCGCTSNYGGAILDRTNCKWSEPQEPHRFIGANPGTGRTYPLNLDAATTDPEPQEPHRAIPAQGCTCMFEDGEGPCPYCRNLEAENARQTEEIRQLKDANVVIVGTIERGGCIYCGGELTEGTAVMIDGEMDQKHKNTITCLRMVRFRLGDANTEIRRLDKELASVRTEWIRENEEYWKPQQERLSAQLKVAVEALEALGHYYYKNQEIQEALAAIKALEAE